MEFYRLFFVEHDPTVVLISVAVAIGSWWTLLVMGEHLRVGEFNRDLGMARRWQWGRCLVLGFGIWAFHFLGMLAWRPGPSLSFDYIHTLASLILALGAAWPMSQALRRANKPLQTIDVLRLVAFASLLGGMHFIGMLADDLQRSLIAPFALHGRTLSLAILVGVSRTRSVGELRQLLPMARTACEFAERAGVSCLSFEPQMFTNARDQLELQGHLRQAVEKGELSLVVQPKFSALSRRVAGAEALLRWRRSDGTWVSPAQFIPVAERYGLMGAIGDWVVREAIAMQVGWRQQGLQIPLSINISPQQLERDSWIDDLITLLEQAGASPAWFCLEITESAAMLHPDQTVARLKRLRLLGFDVSIDDFGTGHSSLSYLTRLPATELKIDRSFVQSLMTGSVPIVRGTLQMAKALGMRTVAEGVETEQQRECLEACGVEELQGYLLAEPMPAEDLLLKFKSDPRLNVNAFLVRSPNQARRSPAAVWVPRLGGAS